MTFAAVLCCAMTMPVLTSCTIEDNPAPRVDYGEWNLLETDMNTSVRPGDDFFMYCNGGYWNSTELDENTYGMKIPLFQGSDDIIKKRIAELPFPTYDKLLADAAKNDSTEIMTKINATLDRIDTLTTCESAWKLWGELIKEGHTSPLNLYFFSKGGRLGVTFVSTGNDYASIQDMSDKKSLQWQLLNDPDLQDCLHSLGGSDSRRAYDHNIWPMLTTIFTELGFNLDDVYSIDMTSLYAPERIEATTMSYLYSLSDLKTLKDWMRSGVAADTALVKPKKRTELAKRFADKYLKYEKSYIYTEAYVTPEMKQRTLDCCTQLRETFHERIAANEWMSPASKQSAAEKLDAMTFNIGCPDEWFTEVFADISNEKTLLDDVMALRRANLALIRRLAGQETSKASFHALITIYDLTIVNAFYAPNYNSMNIFPAWMSEPLYDPQQNEAHNYATMMVFGHEITHGFDTKGSQFNKFGDHEDIWASDADRQNFQNRAQQLIDCYNNLEIMPWAMPGVYADGAYTITENIADLGGILLAYDTYVRHLTKNGFKGEQFDLQRQRFFMALAKLWQAKYTALYANMVTFGSNGTTTNKDIHSLSRERINGTCMNIDAWYDLFNVTAGDKLYRAPKDRVRIW